MATGLNTPDEILATALRKEEQAYAFYSKLLDMPKADFVRNLIESLRDEEAKHVQKIRKEIVRLNLGK